MDFREADTPPRAYVFVGAAIVGNISVSQAK